MCESDRNIKSMNYIEWEQEVSNIAAKICNEFCVRYNIADKQKAATKFKMYSFACLFDEKTLEYKPDNHNKRKRNTKDNDSINKTKIAPNGTIPIYFRKSNAKGGESGESDENDENDGDNFVHMSEF